MSEKTKNTKQELKKELDSDIVGFLECASITSMQVKFITNNLYEIIDADYKFTQTNQKEYLGNVLALRRSNAYLHYLSTRYVPVHTAETKKLVKVALQKFQAAEAKEEEFKKLYGGFESPELTPEEFLKYIKE